MKFAFIAAERVSYVVEMLCNAIEVSHSGYHAWTKRPTPPRAHVDARLALESAAVHRRSRGGVGMLSSNREQQLPRRITAACGAQITRSKRGYAADTRQLPAWMRAQESQRAE